MLGQTFFIKFINNKKTFFIIYIFTETNSDLEVMSSAPGDTAQKQPKLGLRHSQILLILTQK